MRSHEYRSIIQIIIRNTLRKKFPHIKFKELNSAAKEISTAIHARFYGANIDNVASPIWRNDEEGFPHIPAQELLDHDFDAMG